jgi:hypothetical protein
LKPDSENLGGKIMLCQWKNTGKDGGKRVVRKLFEICFRKIKIV